MLGRLVSCLWYDAHGDVQTEMGSEEIALATSYKFTTYGILVRDDRNREDVKDKIVGIAAERGQDGRYRGITWIPAAMVVEIVDRGAEIVKPKRTRKTKELENGKDTRREGILSTPDTTGNTGLTGRAEDGRSAEGPIQGQ